MPAAARTAMAERRSLLSRWARPTTMNSPRPMSANSRSPYWNRNFTASRPIVALAAV